MKRALLIFATLLVCFSAQAQTYPFPQGVKYPYGYMSTKITSADAKTEYDSWIKSYYSDCSSTEGRITTAPGGSEALSEGTGYGLVLTAYAGDKTRFTKLWNFYRNRRNVRGVMNWQYTDCTPGDNKKNGATDGDLDAAMGIVIACIQWPTETAWVTQAKELLTAIKTSEFEDCSGKTVQKPGDVWGGCTCTNPSYYATGYYHVWAKFYESQGDATTAAFWNQAATDAYYTLNKNSNTYTGLFYAWCNKDGGVYSGCSPAVGGGGGPQDYQYDACRTPWRIAMDYVWFGNADAGAILKKITTFVKTPASSQTGGWYGAGGIDKVVDGYAHNGSKLGQYHNTPFVGSFALASMASSQTDADAFLGHFQTMKGDNYFNTCLSVLYKFLATGNFWNPYSGSKCPTPELGATQTLCGAGSATLTTGIAVDNKKTFEWFKDGQSLGAASTIRNTLTVTAAGVYKVVIDSLGKCSSNDNVTVSSTLPAISLGADVDLCNPSSVTFDAGVSGTGLTYTWKKNGTAIATTKTLTVTTAGTYNCTVSDKICAAVSDEVIVTSKLPVVLGDTICKAGVATLKAPATGTFDWFDVATGGTKLTTINTYAPTISATKTFYVQDAESFSGSVGPKTALASTQSWGVNTGNHLKFTVSSDFTLSAFKIHLGDVYNNTNHVFVFEVLDANGASFSPAKTFTASVALTTSNGNSLFRIPLNGVTILKSWGTNLRLRINSITPNAGVLFSSAGASYPYNSTPSGIVSITGTAGGNSGSAEYMYFYDWEISSGSSCARVPVTAVINANAAKCTQTDTDGDGTPDASDGCPTDKNKIAAGQCGCGVLDTDTDKDGTADCLDTDDDGDGVADAVDCAPLDKTIGTITWYADADGDGKGDAATTKTACTQPGGYVADKTDGCPTDKNKIAAGQCGCGVVDTDTDNDGTADCLDTDDDGDGVADAVDCAPLDKTIGTITWYADADGDGKGDAATIKTACTQPVGYVADKTDGCPTDKNKIAAGQCGCGVVDTDTDNDGTADCLDTDDDGDGVADAVDCAPLDKTIGTITWYADADGDGKGDAATTKTACTQPTGYVADKTDGCPTDKNKVAAGQCGCGVVDTDTDKDGTADCLDTDDDGDGVADAVDCAPLDKTIGTITWYADADGDGKGDAATTKNACTQPVGYVADKTDGCPTDKNKVAAGQCGCGVVDTDTDNDGTADCLDTDDDGDGVADAVDCAPLDKTIGTITWYADADGDGKGDAASTKTACTQPTGYVADKTDGCPTDKNKVVAGQCGCGVVDTDTDKDGTADCLDTDDDGDGVADAVDCAPLDKTIGTITWYADTDGDGKGDAATTKTACTQPAGYVADKTDGCPTDKNKVAAGQCGCGVVDGTCDITQDLTLTAGWNLISLYVQPTDSSVATNVASLGANLLYIKNLVAFYDPSQNASFNKLSSFVRGHAYLIKVSTDATWSVSGKPLSNTNISLTTGWNLLGYPSQASGDISKLLQNNWSIFSSLKNFEGFYTKNGTLNSLSTMNPGKGYFIKTTGSGVIIIP